MSNQERSEQPVAVCPDCGSDDPAQKHQVHEADCAGIRGKWCSNPFHSSTEQGSKPTAAETIGWMATQKKRGEPQTGFPKPEPTAQTVAGEPEQMEPCTELDNEMELADLRRQLAEVTSKFEASKSAQPWAIAYEAEKSRREVVEKQLAEKDTQIDALTKQRDAAILAHNRTCITPDAPCATLDDMREKVVALQAVVEKVKEIECSEDGMTVDEKLNAIHATVSASPSTVLESIREEERERTRKEAIDECIREAKSIADRAYCDGINATMRFECCGWEAKVKDGEFGKRELDAHRNAASLFGRSDGLHALIAAIRQKSQETKQ